MRKTLEYIKHAIETGSFNANTAMQRIGEALKGNESKELERSCENTFHSDFGIDNPVCSHCGKDFEHWQSKEGV